MKYPLTPIFTSANFLIVTLAIASTSENYSIPIQSIDEGGGPSSAGLYQTTSSIGGIGGIHASTKPAYVDRGGFPGQLYELESLSLYATPSSVNEGASSQLSPVVSLDDGTTLLPGPTSVGWSILSGPVNAISTGGLATTGTVYQTETASLQGSYEGLSGTTSLIIVNFNADNYGGYGADGIDDDWQVGYFGEPPNSDAAPGANPDGDRDDNEMEFLAGFNPTDPNEWFKLEVLGKTGTATTLQLNKVIPGRTYTVRAGTDLVSFGETITTFSVGTQEANKILLDPSATSDLKFYQVEVTRP